MKATVRKTTIGEHNGFPSSPYKGPAGCYYNGYSACWAVDTTDAQGGEYHVAFSRKWAAEGLASWVNDGNWDGTGDLMLVWAGDYQHPTQRRFLDSKTVREI